MKQIDEQIPGQAIPTLIDNRPSNHTLDAVRRLMVESQTLDLATGYFETGSMVALDGAWQTLKKIRLLMGDELTRATKAQILEGLENKDRNGIEGAKIFDDWRALEGLESIKAALAQGIIEAKVYTKAKFHAKAMHFKTGGIVNHGIIGSSNFTYKGLTQNLELNLFTSDNSQLRELEAWFQQVWDEAEDIYDDLIKIIDPHVRKYDPFIIYLQAMRERFASMEPTKDSWEYSHPLYNELARYQKDAYHDLVHMGETWGGGLLCDGVGLGKTYVGLMLIAKALKERKRVLVIAPKAAIPSVWNKNLAKYFEDDFDPNPEYQHDIRVIPMTDFGREDTITNERLEKLRNRYDVILIDEAHHFRVPHSNRSGRIKELTKDKIVYLLTATPVNNTLLDLYILINYIAQDKRDKFQEVGVSNLRGWFNEKMSEQNDESKFEIFQSPDFEDFLKHIIVQRSRSYVKKLEKQQDETVKFPVREKPEVINYSLKEVYGKLFPKLLEAFAKDRALLRLVIYETEKFKEQGQDIEKLQEQSNVVGLIRTLLLKRLESSGQALQSSLEDLLYKHIILLKSLHELRHSAFLGEFDDVNQRLEENRRERLGINEGELEDEEEEELPLTHYEQEKVDKVKADIKEFGSNEIQWLDLLESDARHLAAILRELYALNKPENDAKLQAFIQKIRETDRLSKEKFVVFSEFKDTARYLAQQLEIAFPKDAIVEVDSGRNVNNREKVIQRFAPYYNCDNEAQLNEALKDPIRILVSTDVLSEGLNLQDANIIVNYDLHWNPVRLMQRIGRVDRRMDPSKPVDYDKVYVYNFLPPRELDEVLGLYKTITGKLIAINRALGIEAPVLEANDDVRALDLYLNLGEGKESVAEQLRRLAVKLEADHAALWEETKQLPNRIYSGKPEPQEPVRSPLPLGEGLADDGRARGEEDAENRKLKTENRFLFLCYRVPIGYDKDEPDIPPTMETKWFLIDRVTGEITEDLESIHNAIQCLESTPRKVDTPTDERTRLRKEVEKKCIDEIIFRMQVPAQYKYELVCWMEIG